MRNRQRLGRVLWRHFAQGDAGRGRNRWRRRAAIFAFRRHIRRLVGSWRRWLWLARRDHDAMNFEHFDGRWCGHGRGCRWRFSFRRVSSFWHRGRYFWLDSRLSNSRLRHNGWLQSDSGRGFGG